MPRIKTFAVSAHCRGRPGLHHETQKFETQVHASGNSSSIFPTWSTINLFSRFAHAKTYLNTLIPNCMDFSRSGNFPDSRSHRFCIAGINPCNPEFESLHRYPLSCASVSEKSVSKTLCADQKSRQSFNRPHLEFLVACAAQCWFVSRHIHFIMHIHSSNDDVISTTFIAYL